MTFPLIKVGGWADDVDTITGAQITALDTTHVNAIDGAGGGNYNPAVPVGIGGAAGGLLLTETAGAASNIKLAAREANRLLSTTGRCSYAALANTWEIQATTGYWWQILTGGHVFIDLPIPNGQRLDQVTVKYIGAAGYANPGPLPGTMPSVTVEKVDALGGITLAGPGPVLDPSGTITAFKALHDITVPAINAVIDRATYVYRAKIMGDDGANFQSGSRIISIYVRVNCTGYTEY